MYTVLLRACERARELLAPHEGDAPDVGIHAAFWLFVQCGRDCHASTLYPFVSGEQPAIDPQQLFDLPYLSVQGFRLGSGLLAFDDTRARELRAALLRVSRRKPRTEELTGPADDPLCLLGLILLSKLVTPQSTVLFESWVDAASLSPTLRAAFILGGVKGLERGLQLEVSSPQSLAAYLLLSAADKRLGARLYPAVSHPEVLSLLATIDLGEHLSRAAFDSLVVLVALELLLHDEGPPSRAEMGSTIGIAVCSSHASSSRRPTTLGLPPEHTGEQAIPREDGARPGNRSSSLLAPVRLAGHSGVNVGEHPNRADELRKLLIASFSADEFRRFVRFGPDGVTLAPELPGDIASLAQLAASAVELFERVHLVTDPAFWRRLVKERERRAAEIEQVRVMYMTAGTPAMPSLQAPADLHDALLVIGFFRELARLFDVQRVVNLMHRAGLDPSNFATVYTPTPKAWWETVAREIRQGAVSEPLRSLRELARAAGEDYPANPVMVRAGELTR